MIKIIKATYHDKKKNKLWHTVNGTHNAIRFISIIETNIKDATTKINFIRVHTTTPEEQQTAHLAGLKADQSILNLLSNEDIETIINSPDHL